MVIAVANLAGLTVPTADLGQIAALLFRLWILAVSIALVRRAEEARPTLSRAPV